MFLKFQLKFILTEFLTITQIFSPGEIPLAGLPDFGKKYAIFHFTSRRTCYTCTLTKKINNNNNNTMMTMF